MARLVRFHLFQLSGCGFAQLCLRNIIRFSGFLDAVAVFSNISLKDQPQDLLIFGGDRLPANFESVTHFSACL